MIQRTAILATLNKALARSRVVIVTGPPQSGKTTLARELVDAESINYFDLEDPASLARLELLRTKPHDEAFFWATHQGAEIDLVLRCGSDLFGIECKRTDQPRLTPSIKSALADLGLKRVIVIYPGIQRFPLANRVEAVPLQAIAGAVSLFEGGEA